MSAEGCDRPAPTDPPARAIITDHRPGSVYAGGARGSDAQTDDAGPSCDQRPRFAAERSEVRAHGIVGDDQALDAERRGQPRGEFAEVGDIAIEPGHPAGDRRDRWNAEAVCGLTAQLENGAEDVVPVPEPIQLEFRRMAVASDQAQPGLGLPDVER